MVKTPNMFLFTGHVFMVEGIFALVMGMFQEKGKPKESLHPLQKRLSFGHKGG